MKNPIAWMALLSGVAMIAAQLVEIWRVLRARKSSVVSADPDVHYTKIRVTRVQMNIRDARLGVVVLIGPPKVNLVGNQGLETLKRFDSGRPAAVA